MPSIAEQLAYPDACEEERQEGVCDETNKGPDNNKYAEVDTRRVTAIDARPDVTPIRNETELDDGEEAVVGNVRHKMSVSARMRCRGTHAMMPNSTEWYQNMFG